MGDATAGSNDNNNDNDNNKGGGARRRRTDDNADKDDEANGGDSLNRTVVGQCYGRPRDWHPARGPGVVHVEASAGICGRLFADNDWTGGGGGGRGGIRWGACCKD